MSPPPADSVSTGELGRRLDTLITESREFRIEVNDRFTSLDGTFVRTEVHDLVVKALTERLTKVETNLSWVAKTIGTSIFAAVVGGLITAAKLGGVG